MTFETREEAATATAAICWYSLKIEVTERRIETGNFLIGHTYAIVAQACFCGINGTKLHA